MRTSLLLLLLFAIFSSSQALPSAGRASLKVAGPLVGEWKPIEDVNAPEVREVAEFAVAEHNKQQGNDAARLTFSKVVTGETQVVAGLNYRLLLVATDEAGVAAQYEAVVWEKSWQKLMRLTSFRRINS